MKHEYTGQMAQAFLGTPAVISQVEPMKRRRPKDVPETVSDDIGVMVRADGCVLAQISLPSGALGGLTQADVTERNLALDFIKAKLDGLVLEVRGGEFNKVEYRGTATGITILNPTPAPGNPGKS